MEFRKFCLSVLIVVCGCCGVCSGSSSNITADMNVEQVLAFDNGGADG